MDTIDLHIHSTFSDGTFTPSEIVGLAKDKGLSAIALTDHDTLDGFHEAAAAGRNYGLEVVTGIELSTVFDQIEIHILGYLIDDNPTVLDGLTSESQKNRLERNILIVQKLNEAGFKITFGELKEFSKEDILSRTHIAQLMQKKSYVPTVREAFRRYLSPWCNTYVPMRSFTAEKTIELIRNAGGIAALAHPVLYGLNYKEIDEMVSELTSFGLQGMECIYSAYTEREEAEMLRIAEKYGLCVTGGSDFHGAVRDEVALGCADVPISVLENMKKLKSDHNKF